MKTALLVIDVQRGLFAQTPAPFEADAVVDRINNLATCARQAGAPVVFIQHERATLAFQSEGWQLVDTLVVETGDVLIRKTTPDSFQRTELGETLADLGIERVVICGFASEFCVDTTTRRAAALGYEVTLAADAHTTQDKPHMDAATIRAHENATLPAIVSFGPAIRAIASADIVF